MLPMEKIMKFLFLYVLYFMVATPAYAYLDPGTGSILVSTIIAVVSTVLFVAKDWFYRIFKGQNIPSISKNNKIHEIVIWSEAKHYWPTFAPMVDYLQKHNIPFTYLASDKNDGGLKHTENNQYIGLNGRTFSYLNQISAHVMVMTTPNLGDLAIKRSKNVNHYIHVVHSISDIHLYRRVAFDCFDTIMCSGDYQIKTLRMLEKIRGTDAKNLVQTGCLYYDSMPTPNKKTSSTGIKTVLIAPAWGQNNILKYYNILLPRLLERGYNIIIRPHPQSFKSDKKLLAQVQKDFPNSEKITWDKKTDNMWACEHSDVMISHFSMIIFDYALVHKKPVLVFDTPISKKDCEWVDMPQHNAWELKQNHLFETITLDHMDKIGDAVEKTLNRKMPLSFAKKHIYNFQKAGAVAGQQLIDIYHRVRNHA